MKGIFDEPRPNQPRRRAVHGCPLRWNGARERGSLSKLQEPNALSNLYPHVSSDGDGLGRTRPFPRHAEPWSAAQARARATAATNRAEACENSRCSQAVRGQIGANANWSSILISW
jgi:hypothetical protein